LSLFTDSASTADYLLEKGKIQKNNIEENHNEICVNVSMLIPIMLLSGNNLLQSSFDFFLGLDARLLTAFLSILTGTDCKNIKINFNIIKKNEDS